MDRPKADPRDIQRAIRELEGLDARTASVSDYEQHLTLLLRGYAVKAPKFDPGVYMYRGRLCSKPACLAEIFYPPTAVVTSMGRANDVGQSIFYAATARAVPFFELGVKAGDCIALSKWKTVGAMILNHIGFSMEPASFRDAKRQLDKVYRFIEDTRAIGDLNALVHDYLAYQFSQAVADSDTSHYKFTLAISRKHSAGDMFDGLLYPTIQMFGNADNIALKPEAADKLLRLVSVEYVAVKAVHCSKMDVELLDSATTANPGGTLNWSGRRLQWKIRENGGELRFVSEGGEWVAYDKHSNRVDPE